MWTRNVGQARTAPWCGPRHVPLHRGESPLFRVASVTVEVAPSESLPNRNRLNQKVAAVCRPGTRSTERLTELLAPLLPACRRVTARRVCTSYPLVFYLHPTP